MPSRRVERLSALIREEISDLLQREVHDPRLRQFISVTRVDVAPDLKTARVFVSILGGDEEKREAIKGFCAATGFLRKELGNRIPVRVIPELSFHLDESIARGEGVLDLLNRVRQDTVDCAPGEEEKESA